MPGKEKWYPSLQFSENLKDGNTTPSSMEREKCSAPAVSGKYLQTDSDKKTG